MTKLKEVFETKDKDGKAIKLAVNVPSADIKQKARHAHAKAYANALKEGAMMIQVLDRYLREQNLWDDTRQEEFDKLRNFIIDSEAKLEGGNIKLKEAKAIALEMSTKRAELANLMSLRNEAELNTADKIADQQQFNFYVAHCTIHNETGTPYFTKDGVTPSLEAYIERSSETAAFDAAKTLAEILYGKEKDILDKLPEVQFLKKYRFANEDGHLIDDKKRLVDDKGRLVDKDGRFINEAGEYVDSQGRRVDKDGRFVKEFKPFLDDNGKPIVEDVVNPAKPPAPQPKVEEKE